MGKNKNFKMKLFGTLTLASLANAQFDFKPIDFKPIPFEPIKDLTDFGNDKNGMIGGFSDEPMEFPGKGPMEFPGKGPMEFPSKGPGFMSGMDMPPMGDGTDGMSGPMEMVKMKIAAIKDVEDVKGILTAIVEMMMAKMDDKPEMPGKSKGLPQRAKAPRVKEK